MDLSPFWKPIINTLNEGVLIVDPRGTILALNAAAEAITGYNASELVGKNCRILECTGCTIYGRGSGAAWCQLFRDGAVQAKKCLIAHKARRSVCIVKNATVLRDARGKIIGAVETLSDISEIVRQQDEILSLRQTLELDDHFFGIVGRSAPMQRLYELIRHVARAETPVLIQGESGTGKERVARAIHGASPREGKPFIKVNCAALNENLLESELFGHIRGAYTGAERSRIGRFEAAHGGSIFLDEIGDIPLSLQVKLLRVLEEKEVERVGDHTPVAIDVRVITATNRNLEERISRGLFREDLFFRINVFPIFVPPLRERPEDIPILVRHFLAQHRLRNPSGGTGISAEAVRRLTAYSWPGNVRELRNAIDYALVLCPSGEIQPEHLPAKISSATCLCPPPRTLFPVSQRERILQAMRQTGGNRTKAARLLGISRVTLWKHLKRLAMDVETR